MIDQSDLQPVEPGYKNVLRARLLVFWLVLSGGALFVQYVLSDVSRLIVALPVGTIAVGLAAVAIAPQRIYRRLRCGLSDRFLEVARGWLFHTDTVVPLVRVQHLDVIRGPF